MEFKHLKNILIGHDECMLFYMDARGYQISELAEQFPQIKIILVEDSKYQDDRQHFLDHPKDMHAIYIIASEKDAVLLKLKHNI